MRRTARKSSKKVCIPLVVIIPVIIFLFSFTTVLFDKAFYEKQFAGSGVNITMARETTEFLMDYFSAEVDAEPDFRLFTEEEKEHIADVKEVIGWVIFLFYLLIVSAALFIYFNYRSCKWGRTLLYSGIAAVAVPAALYVIPFDFIFSVFHQIFFEPGTWTFPAGSTLITVYPFSFFYNAAFAVFFRGFVTGWLLIIFGFAVGKTKG